METFALDGIINFCDDMEIAEENILIYAGKQIWNSLIAAFHKITLFFKNFAVRLNMFKSCKMPKKMNSDLIKSLEILTPRRYGYQNMGWESLMTVLEMRSNSENMVKNSTSDNAFKIIHDDMYAGSEECRFIQEKADKSDFYHRVLKHDYSEEDMSDTEPIILGYMVKQCVDSNKAIDKFTNHIRKIENMIHNRKYSTKVNEALSWASKLSHRIIAIYHSRIELFNIYFHVAKFSMSAAKDNFKSITDKNKQDFDSRKFKGAYFLKRSIVKFDSSEEYNAAAEILSDMLMCDTVNTPFSDYLPKRQKVCAMAKIPDTSTVYASQASFIGNNSLLLQYNPEPCHKLQLSEDVKLYHTSTNPNITELNPRYRTNGGVFWRTPRVYFSVMRPIDRTGADAGNTYCYELTAPVSDVYIDKELGGNAVFVETERDLPVKLFNLEDWRSDVSNTLNNSQ